MAALHEARPDGGRTRGRHGPGDGHTERLAHLSEVEATAAATPACAGGMPITAVLVIGGLIMPKPIPKMK